MRVSIDHGETTTGLFAKKTHYTVSVTVQFSEEEKQIIRQRKLEKSIVLERSIPSDRDPRKFDGIEDVFNLTIHKLMGGTDTYTLETPLEAKEYDEVLRAGLQDLKAFIVGNESVEEKSSSFEL